MKSGVIVVIVHLKYHVHLESLRLRSTLNPERGCDLCLELLVMAIPSPVFSKFTLTEINEFTVHIITWPSWKTISVYIQT